MQVIIGTVIVSYGIDCFIVIMPLLGNIVIMPLLGKVFNVATNLPNFGQ